MKAVLMVSVGEKQASIIMRSAHQHSTGLTGTAKGAAMNFQAMNSVLLSLSS